MEKVSAEEMKKMGTHKDWETYVINDEKGKVCFAQSKPVLQAPKNNPREARLFISFRPEENVANEISVTGGYEFNNKNLVKVTSGKNKYKFDLIQDGFAWMSDTDNNLEKKMIKTMKKGSRIMVAGHTQNGSRTIDHYSLLGFTKAYNATKANCS
ncbi:invasion associated locus B family protein [Candidatus Pelagibacter sp. Uisw_106]|uniref:invasion associated locus B family protein n=1 Tax=Candidatus Pelagibacter sp. Uisw_106 TaxID=3230984 RepID=UPI0039EC2C9B